jgi:hypothetical protein
LIANSRRFEHAKVFAQSCDVLRGNGARTASIGHSQARMVKGYYDLDTGKVEWAGK